MKLKIANQWGNVEVANMSKAYVHIRGQRLQPLCRANKIKYADAMIGWGGTSRYPKPQLYGVVVHRSQAAKLESLIADRNARAANRPEARRVAATIAHWQARSEQRVKREQQFCAAIGKRYPSWREALLPACEVMFNLNRAVMHGRHDKDYIYSLKNRLVELLYLQGACIECLAHQRMLPGKECYGCDGMGCERCNQSGWWVEPRRVRDIAFRFMVCGRVFSWHQPDHLITFDYEVSATEQGSPKEEKPVEMSWRRMERGKHIIRYVLDNASCLCQEAA